MYFQQQNFFPSMNQSAEDLKKMMGLSMSQNEDKMLETLGDGNGNDYCQTSNNNEEDHCYQDDDSLSQSQYQSGNQIVIQSSEQTYTINPHEINQTYAKYQTQIKSLLPEVTYLLIYLLQIHSHLIKKHYARYQSIYQEKINNYQVDIAEKYREQISNKIDTIKENINQNLTHKIAHINSLKEQIHSVKKTLKSTSSLTPEQQQELVQKTINGIFTSQKLLNEIKQKLKPKIQERVKFILLRDLQKQLTRCQNQIQDKIAQQRQQFKQKRRLYWQREAESELSELAVEYEQLKGKKESMEEIVKQRLVEKQQIVKKHKQAMEKCQRVKQLQKQIKQMQQQINNKYSKNTNKRSLSKGGIEAKPKRIH